MSHHLSGPRAMAESAADITDLFAFPSPEQPGRLVLVLNTFPFAPPSALFSDGLIYRFRLRPLTGNAAENPVPFGADGDEIMIDCVFSAPGSGDGMNGPEQEVTCQLPDGQTISARVNDERGGQAEHELGNHEPGPVHALLQHRIDDAHEAVADPRQDHR